MQNWAGLGAVAFLVVVVRNNNGREIKVGCVHVRSAEGMLFQRSRGAIGGAATATTRGRPKVESESLFGIQFWLEA